MGQEKGRCIERGCGEKRDVYLVIQSQLLSLLIISFYFLHSDALTSGALHTLEGLPLTGLANSERW